MPRINEPLYDRARAIEQLAGDEALFAAIAGVFVGECGGYCAALETALASGNLADLRREAHSVKSTLASFACEGGRALAQHLESLAASGLPNGAPEVTAELVSVMKRLAGALEKDAG